jgi:hypothetical protein
MRPLARSVKLGQRTGRDPLMELGMVAKMELS